MKNVILFLLIFNAALVNAQSSFIPQKLGDEINSTTHDVNPVLSPDGATLYFTRINHPDNRFGAGDSEDIWFSEKQANGSWAPAKNLNYLNIGRYNAVLFVMGDGKSLLINGVYNKNGNIWKKRGISVVTKTDYGWSNPERVNIPTLSRRNRGRKSHASFSADGNYLIMSFSPRFNGKKSNFYISEKSNDNTWRRPKKVAALSSRFSDDTPFLLADGKTVYFSSNRAHKDRYDIYRSSRQGIKITDWMEPVRLNDTINASQWQAYLKTNARGSYGLFSSTKESNDNADIYQVKLFEEKPYIAITAKVIHAINERPLKGKNIKVLVNGLETDSIAFQSDSAKFKMKVPFGRKMEIGGALAHYTIDSVIVDATASKEFQEREIILYAKPSPFVRVHGTVSIAPIKQQLPASADAILMLNGTPHATTIRENGQYSLNVEHGKKHILAVKANGFETIGYTLDLTHIDEFIDTLVDLSVTEEKMALLTGQILDKKSGKVFSNMKAVSIVVEGHPGIAAAIDTVNSTYEVKLPLKSMYIISASAKDYYPVYESIDVTNERGAIKILKDLIIVPIEVGQSIRLNNIFFETGKSILKAESFAELNRVADFLKNNDKIRIEIAGHTDNVGSAATNASLSKARAKSVANYVIKQGIDEKRILSNGYGFSKPVASNKTAEGKAQNRRVEFTILEKK